MEILLITHNYPYNVGDTAFIKPEIQFLSGAFEKIHVISMQNDRLRYEKVEVPNNLYIVPMEMFILKFANKYQRLKSVLLPSFHLFKLVYILFFEFRIILKQRKFKIGVFKSTIGYLLNAYFIAIFIRQYLLQNPEIKLIYTYWYTYETLASLICKKYFNIPIKCMTRTHGYDLYEYTQKNNYQPYKNWMDKYIDCIFFISRDGYNYYQKIFANSNKDKYIISKLGIKNPYLLQDISNEEYLKGSLNIVSCSNMVSVKRIQLIILALSRITDISIKWTHIGDGVERDKLEIMAKNSFENKENIIYSFLGFLDNDIIKKYYHDNYFNCFVSTSESEGLPVSMMEALSFGIPVIASNVGGVPEIVNNDTGILLDPDNCVEELVNALHQFAVMTTQEIMKLRESCRRYWEDNFRAETQYTQFVKHIMDLNNNG